MTYMCGNPKQTVTRQVTEGDATAGQNYIPIPGGLVPGSCDVFVGGANLSSLAPNPDYSDSDGMGIALTTPMQAGTRFRVVVTLRTSGQIQQVSRQVTEGQATQGQTVIPIPGGYPPSQGMVDVAVNGADLSVGDFDDSSGTQIVLAKAMNAGMQYRVVSYANYMNVASVSGQLAGFRNRIINGACQVQQRSNLTLTAGVSGYGAVDRFQSNNSTSAGQLLLGVGNLIGEAAVQITVQTAIGVVTGTNLALGIQQRIEGYNCYDMIGGTASLSFGFYANVNGLYSVQLFEPTSGQSYVTSFNYTNQAGVVAQIKLPAIPMPSTLKMPNTNALGLLITIGALNTGNYQSASGSLNAWQAGNIITAPNAVNWGATANNLFCVTDLQFEAGSVCTPFERRLINFELAQCQRYYEVAQVNDNWYVNAAGTMNKLWGFRVAKRVAPTLNFANISYGGGATLNTSAAYVDSFCITTNAVAGTNFIGGNVSASAEL